MNGQRETANAFLVNGGDVSEGRNLGAGLVPNLDSIEEFRLITNSFDAEYGKFSGAVINAITKSGTNGFHGDAFEFLRNDKLDAKNYFAPSKSELRRNQFGYAAGGPFWKNKLFWFSDYQGTRQVQVRKLVLFRYRRQPSVKASLTLRLGAERQHGTCATSTNCIDGAYWAQVLSQRLGYAVAQNEPYSFAGCGGTDSSDRCVFPDGVIPQAAFSAPAIAILPYIPAPTLPGDTNNYSDNSQRNIANDNKFGERVDFNNEKTGNWSWYYHLDNSNVTSANVNQATGSYRHRAGLSDAHAFARARVRDEQHQDSRSDSSERGPDKLLPDRTAQGQSSWEFCEPVVAWFRNRRRHPGHCPAGRIYTVCASDDV